MVTGGQQNSHETTIAARRTGSWNADGAAGARSNDYRKACLRGEPNGKSSTTDEGIPGVHGPLLARLLLSPQRGYHESGGRDLTHRYGTRAPL